MTVLDNRAMGNCGPYSVYFIEQTINHKARNKIVMLALNIVGPIGEMEPDFWSAEALVARLREAKVLTSDLIGYSGVRSLELGDEIKSSAQAMVYRAILNGTQVFIK